MEALAFILYALCILMLFLVDLVWFWVWFVLQHESGDGVLLGTGLCLLLGDCLHVPLSGLNLHLPYCCISHLVPHDAVFTRTQGHECMVSCWMICPGCFH